MEKPEALQELEIALSKMTNAEETIRLSKNKIKASLPKLRDATKTEDERLRLASYLLEKYDGSYGINKTTVSAAVLGCSWPEMEKRLGPTTKTCSRCGTILHYQAQKIDIQDGSGFFRDKVVPRGWSCLPCADIPAWMIKKSKKSDIKSKILRRFNRMPFSLGDYTYGIGDSSMVRTPRLADYGEPDFPELANEITSNLDSYLRTGDLGFTPMPKMPKINYNYQNYSKFAFLVGNKIITLDDLLRIDGLPEIEIAPKITGPNEPMVFRFTFGAGMVRSIESARVPENSYNFFLSANEWIRTRQDFS